MLKDLPIPKIFPYVSDDSDTLCTCLLPPSPPFFLKTHVSGFNTSSLFIKNPQFQEILKYYRSLNLLNPNNLDVFSLKGRLTRGKRKKTKQTLP